VAKIVPQIYSNCANEMLIYVIGNGLVQAMMI